MYGPPKSMQNKNKKESKTPSRLTSNKIDSSGNVSEAKSNFLDMPIASKKSKLVELPKKVASSARNDEKENYSESHPHQMNIDRSSRDASHKLSDHRSSSKSKGTVKSKTPDFKGETRHSKKIEEHGEFLQIEDESEYHHKSYHQRENTNHEQVKPASRTTRNNQAGLRTPSRYSSRPEETKSTKSTKSALSPGRNEANSSFSKLKRSVNETRHHQNGNEEFNEDEDTENDTDASDRLLDSLRIKCQSQYNPDKLTAQFINIVNNPVRRDQSDMMPKDKCHKKKDGRNYMAIGGVDIYFDHVDIEDILNFGLRSKIGTGATH